MTSESDPGADAILARYREAVVDDRATEALRTRLAPELQAALATSGGLSGVRTPMRLLRGAMTGAVVVAVTAVGLSGLSASSQRFTRSGEGTPSATDNGAPPAAPPLARETGPSVQPPAHRGRAGDPAEGAGEPPVVVSPTVSEPTHEVSTPSPAKVEPRRRGHPSKRRPASTSSEPEPALPFTRNGFVEELKLIKEARSELGAGRAAATLETLQEHQLRFGDSGTFGAERMLLFVMAQCEAGDTQAALGGAKDFRQRNPRHPLNKRLSNTCVGE